jgi:hypothetical protein
VPPANLNANPEANFQREGLLEALREKEEII